MTRNIDTTDLDIEKTSEVVMPATGRLKREKLKEDVQEIEVASVYGIGDKAARLAFLEEYMDVMVHESADPNAEMIVETWVNGVPQRFIRGQVQTVRRKYVNVLANAKHTGITTRAEVGSRGDAETVIKKHSALRYPFSVIRDENPKGAQWLREELAR